jgi:multidrug efflux system membrane fusion protein
MASEKPLPTHRRNALLAGILIITVVIAGFAGWHYRWSDSSSAMALAVAAAVPVTTATAQRADVPIYLTGLGTVQAFNTVTIRTQIDGQLFRVAFTEGQEVKTGDFLAQIDPRTYQAALDQAIARKAQDEANLVNAKLDLQRYSDLASQDFASRQQLDTQRALVAQIEAQIQSDQAAIVAAQTQLGYTTITSPLDGRTGIRQVDQGNIVHTTDASGLVIITQLHPISVIFTLPEGRLTTIQSAMASGPVRLFAMNRDGDRPLAEGTLAVLDNEIDQATGTLRLKGTFPNDDGALWPGLFVNIRLHAHTARSVVTVPSTALQHGPDGYYAYIVKPDGTAEMRPLKVGYIGDGLAIIEAGIAVDEEVVTAGQSRLEPGARVETASANASH